MKTMSIILVIIAAMNIIRIEGQLICNGLNKSFKRKKFNLRRRSTRKVGLSERWLRTEPVYLGRWLTKFMVIKICTVFSESYALITL